MLEAKQWALSHLTGYPLLVSILLNMKSVFPI